MEPVDDVQWFLNQVSRDFPDQLEAFTQPDPDALRESLALLLQIKRQAGYQSEYPPTAAAYPRTAMAAASASKDAEITKLKGELKGPSPSCKRMFLEFMASPTEPAITSHFASTSDPPLCEVCLPVKIGANPK